jgi:hypothetical protein
MEQSVHEICGLVGHRAVCDALHYKKNPLAAILTLVAGLMA